MKTTKINQMWMGNRIDSDWHEYVGSEVQAMRDGTSSAMDRQEGGSHYQLPIQPIEYIHKNNLGFIQGNVVKYITRYKEKNGKQDLEKIKHYIDLLIEMEY